MQQTWKLEHPLPPGNTKTSVPAVRAALPMAYLALPLVLLFKVSLTETRFSGWHVGTYRDAVECGFFRRLTLFPPHFVGVFLFKTCGSLSLSADEGAG